MRRQLTFTDIKAARAFIARIDAAHGWPNATTKTWMAEPAPHPTTRGLWTVPIKDRVLFCLTDAEKLALRAPVIAPDVRVMGAKGAKSLAAPQTPKPKRLLIAALLAAAAAAGAALILWQM